MYNNNLLMTTLLVVLLATTLPSYYVYAAPVKKDTNRKCKAWADAGECDKNAGYMRTSCQTSCKEYDHKMGIQSKDDDDAASIAHIKNFFQLSALDIDNKELPFSDLKGKITVIVNVASRCGYTESHYKGLKLLFDSVKDTKSVEILAFPSNQFGKQEPGTCEEIKMFATKEKGAEYRIMNKIDVNGPAAHQVYKFLKKEAGPASISWNFSTYFVVSPAGVVRSYSGVEPMDLQELIVGLLENKEL
eukprot:scaffold10583_cov290-Chaetoceros_neogracile.AAC.24